MTEAIALLQLALSLLMAAQSPFVTPELREQAISVAYVAIAKAQETTSTINQPIPTASPIEVVQSVGVVKPQGFCTLTATLEGKYDALVSWKHENVTGGSLEVMHELGGPVTQDINGQRVNGVFVQIPIPSYIFHERDSMVFQSAPYFRLTFDDGTNCAARLITE